LETEHGIGDTNSHFGSFWMPGDLGGRTFEVVGVLEDHHSFCGNTFREMLWLFAREILLKQIDFVVLEDAFGGSLNHFFSGIGESQGCISVHLLGIFSLVSGLSWVNLNGPTTLFVLHTFV